MATALAGRDLLDRADLSALLSGGETGFMSVPPEAAVARTVTKRLRVPVKDLYVYPLTGQFRQRLCS